MLSEHSARFSPAGKYADAGTHSPSPDVAKREKAGVATAVVLLPSSSQTKGHDSNCG